MDVRLTIKDAIGLYQSQVGIVNALWKFFGTVTLAVVGYTIGSQKATRSAWEVAMIVGGYALFALAGNLPALCFAYADLRQFSALIDDRVAKLGAGPLPLKHFYVPSVGLVVSFHTAMVTVVALAIVAYALFGRPR
jgi:hypothetical protein